jgi:murein DD-endopeptidase MepM/ murein hydrolase activator NlpD
MLLLLTVFFPFLSSPDIIKKDKERWKPYYTDIQPVHGVKQWRIPFKTNNRTDLRTISVISTFGAKRYSYVRGHFHTGIDLIPKRRHGRFVYVYPMAAGVVCSIHLGDPHQTIVIKHKLPGGGVLYTSYKHLPEVYVKTGEQVTAGTKLARLYTRKEALAQGGNYDHLHLEVRKKFDDYGVASWATLTRADLNRRFSDPLNFMRENITFSDM